ncbi:deoxyribose-phosphate aldolase [Cetobacterium somerae]|uniref:deoxyribose-phosphate aldolase n=1 Tax=Cetobacterium somerae TaxID=188913 RepID=UPI00211DFFB3|nr:deoxyribose-phosphate aldolase [Cetobacterium somerae]MCQ9628343.1 deoxyribose-phosphate aldolase [Cetobacterium somerae]
MNINSFINHMSLGAALEPQQIKVLCNEAKTQRFASVYVNEIYVSLASKELEGSSVKVGTVIGYPFGTSSTKVKIFEVKNAIENGASEISLILNLGMLKSRNIEYIKNELKEIKTTVGKNSLKVVIELEYLTLEEQRNLIDLCLDLKIENIELLKRKISKEDILQIQGLTKNKLNLNLVGNVKDLSTLQRYVDLGIQRFNTTSGLKLSKENNDKFWN